MIDFSEEIAKEENIKSIQLSVRETKTQQYNYFLAKDIMFGEKILTMHL